MHYRILGQTGLKVSVIGFGAWQFGGEWGQQFSQSDANGLLARAEELGINFIDTAECYGDHYSEELIGRFLDSRSSHWIVATKFGHQFTGLYSRAEKWSSSDILRQLEDSLRALKRDYVDLYQFHSGNNAAFDHSDLWETLNAQVQAGKIRHLGISLSPSDNIYQTDLASTKGTKTIQVIYNRLERDAETQVLPSCQRQNLGVIARVPLASGFLGGRYKPEDASRFNDVRSSRWNNEQILEKINLAQTIKQTEVPEGVSLSQWALSWCLKNPAVHCVIPGMKTLAQVESNAQASFLINAP